MINSLVIFSTWVYNTVQIKVNSRELIHFVTTVTIMHSYDNVIL